MPLQALRILRNLKCVICDFVWIVFTIRSPAMTKYISTNIVAEGNLTKIILKCRFCSNNSLDQNLVKGKIVLCDTVDTGEVPFMAGAIGTLMQDSGAKDVAFSFPLPASYLGIEEGSQILSYINITRYQQTVNFSIVIKSNAKDSSLGTPSTLLMPSLAL